VPAPNFTDLTDLFDMLSDPIRLRIVLRLGKGESNPMTLCKEFRLIQPTVSHHLGLLRMNRLVIGKRAGHEVIYALAPHAKSTKDKLGILLPPFRLTVEPYTAAASNLTALANLFHLLSGPVRWQIVLRLAQGENAVTDLGNALKLPQATVSHHLGLLRMDKLAIGKRAGHEVFYSLEANATVAGGGLRFSMPPYRVTVDGLGSHITRDPNAIAVIRERPSWTPLWAGKTPEQWRQLDWTQTNSQVARQIGVSREWVRQIRNMLGVPPLKGIDWAQVDWTQTSKVLAKQLGCTISTVTAKRHLLGQPVARPVPVWQTEACWKGVDWRKPDCVISQERLVAVRLVTEARKFLGKAPPAWRMPNRKHDWQAVDWKKRNRDIALELGVVPSLVSKFRYRLGKGPAEAAGSAS